MTKLEYNRSLIGKNAEVKNGDFTWKGIIVGVKDKDTFIVNRLDRDKQEEVDIYDILSTE